MQKMGRRSFKRPRPHMFIHLLRLLCKVSGDIVASGQSFILLAWGTGEKLQNLSDFGKIWNMAKYGNFLEKNEMFIWCLRRPRNPLLNAFLSHAAMLHVILFGELCGMGTMGTLPSCLDYMTISIGRVSQNLSLLQKTSITVLWVPLVPAKCLPLCRVSTEAHFAGELRASKHHKRQSIAKLSCERCRIDTTAFNAEQDGLQMTSKFLRLCTLKLSSLWIYIYIYIYIHIYIVYIYIVHIYIKGKYYIYIGTLVLAAGSVIECLVAEPQAI